MPAPDSCGTLRHLRVQGNLLRALALRLSSGRHVPAALLSAEFRTHKEILPVCVRPGGDLHSYRPVAVFPGERVPSGNGVPSPGILGLYHNAVV